MTMPYTPRLPPREKQATALDLLENQRSYALLMGMRTGKTATAIHDWGRRVVAGELRDMLVVAPAGAYRPWADPLLPVTELQKHLDPNLYDRTVVGVWRSGGTQANKRQLEKLLATTDRPRVLLVNVEALSTVQMAKDLCHEFLLPRKAMFHVDESVTIKNEKSKRTDTVLRLGELAPYKRILTGLVAPRSPLDLFCQYWFLDWRILGFRSYIAFRSRYAITQKQCFLSWEQLYAKMKLLYRGEHVPTDFSRDEMIEELKKNNRFRWNEMTELVVGYKNEDELRDKIAPYSYRVRLEDCYDVPKREYLIREVRWHPEQRRIYEEMKKFATAELASMSYVTAHAVVAQMMRMHQILCGHSPDESGNKHEIPEYRTDELVDLLRDYDGKAVIWCSYDDDIRKVSERLEKEFGSGSVARFWGGNVKTREEEEQRFKSDPHCRFQVATPDAGGKGRTWDIADLTVFYSSKNNLDHRDQAEMRTQAVDKSRPTTIIDLIMPDTVEMKILEALRAKMDMAGLIQGDDFRSWVI